MAGAQITSSDSFKTNGENIQDIQNHVKHLRWSF